MKSLRYCPELNQITGSITSSLLMCQLEYWFQKRDNKPFYKFLSPCQDEHYYVGDSWTEELGFSKAEFRTALSKIGTAYKTKTEYKKSADPFKGQLYLSYYDRIRKLTYYMRNHALVDKLLRDYDCALPYSLDYSSSKSFTKSYSSLHTTSSAPSLISTTPEATSETTPDSISTPTFTSSSTCTLPAYPASHTTISTSHTATSASTPRTEPTPYTQILELFHKCCPSLNKITALNAPCKRKLDTLYHKLLAQSTNVFAQLEKVFLLAESSDFLCGRDGKKSFKAAFGWIIRLDKFFAILNGNYASHKAISKSNPLTTPMSHSTSKSVASRPSSTFMRMYTHGFNIKELEAREQAYLEMHYGLL